MSELFLSSFVQLNEMNGKLIGRKPLYVAVAQRKEERKAHLQVMLFFKISLLFVPTWFKIRNTSLLSKCHL